MYVAKIKGKILADLYASVKKRKLDVCLFKKPKCMKALP